MTKTVTGAAQGDLLIVPCKSIPTSALPVKPEAGRLILARGEATGHHHSILASRQVALFRDDGTTSTAPLYFKATAPASLDHQEHGTIIFAPGTYKVIRQRVARSGIATRVQD